MTFHIFGSIVTEFGCAANNRGETEGNITTLQKLLWKGQVHTTVSSEAIRWALRYFWQIKGIDVNRKWNEKTEDHQWQDAKWEGWAKKGGTTFIDDDLLGYMKAEGGKSEGEKGSAAKRRGVLEVCRAISTLPYSGDISFNAKSGEKDRTSLYGTEMHATRYQYGFAMTPQRLKDQSRCLDALDGLCALGEVAGNHSRFLFDFSPDSIILRVTEDFAPRILYCYQDSGNTITAPDLIRKIESGDIRSEELFIGGRIAELPEIQKLKPKVCSPGVKAAVDQCKAKIQKQLDLPGKK